MDKISKINVKLISYDSDIGNSRLEFNLSGDNIDYIIANTIRRTMLSDIPIYAFNEFKFEKNTSIFHNNYLKLRFRHIPVWGIDNTTDHIDNQKIVKQVFDPEDEEEAPPDEVELEADTSVNSSSLKQLTMYVNYKNKTDNIVTVTTSDAIFYYNEKQIASPYKVPIPIVKLQGNQEIIFSAITYIGTETTNAMYSPVCVVGYKQKDTDPECKNLDFFLESRGQITEKRILQVALINIEKRMKNFLKVLADTKIDEDLAEGIIVVNNEDHTLGNIISRGMQLHKDVSFAGYNMPHPLANKFNLHYKLKNDKNKILEIIEDVVNYYIEIFDDIKKGINQFKD